MSGKEFLSVAQMKLAHIKDGQTVALQGYHASGDGGGGAYLIMTLAQYGGTPDELGNHTLANGNVAVLQPGRQGNVRQFGAKGDDIADDILSIQAAIDETNAAYFPTGTYRINSSITMPDHCVIEGELGGYASVRLRLVGGTHGIQITSGAPFTKHQVVKGITFDATAPASVGILGSTIYTYAPIIEDCFFDLSLGKGISANLINAKVSRCIFGYYGSPANMSNAIELTGQDGTSEANQNVFTDCVISNVTGDGVVITEGWNNIFNGCTMDNIGGHAINATGGFTVQFINSWAERCGGDGVFAMSSGVSGIFIFSVTNSLIQVLDGSNTRVFNEGGSVQITVQTTGFGSLDTGSFALANNTDKVVLGIDSYYPGGFNDWDTPQITSRDRTILHESFNETHEETSEAVKVLRAKHATFAFSVQSLEANRAASSAYNFSVCRSDVDGSPQVEHELVGNGQARHRGGVGVGNSTAASLLGPLGNVMEVFDMAGVSVGYVPIHNSFTP